MMLRCRRGTAIALEVRVSVVLLERARRDAEVDRMIGPALAAI
jgi:hypothetical protein